MNTSKILSSASTSRRGLMALVIAAGVAAGATSSQASATLIDYGTTAPAPGAHDVSQLAVESGNTPPGLNYYFDNSSPPGQTFTTGANANGYLLNSLFVLTDDNSGGLPSSGQSYTLRIYSVSGAAATLVSSFTSQAGFTFVDYDWLEWTNLDVVLAANTQYAYTLQRDSGGWERMATTSGDLYAGGEAVLIPTAGGSIVSASATGYDAAFDVGLSPITSLTVSTPAVSPASLTSVGVTVTLSATASGGSLYAYQWCTDGGGGALTNIPSATNASLVQDTSAFLPGVYQYSVVVTSGSLSVTSSVAALTLYLSAGATLTDVGNSYTPQQYDISQLAGGGNGDGLNYYCDNSPPPGQTFTTGTNPQGYNLFSVTLGTGGGTSGNVGSAHAYELMIYSVSNNTATLMATLTNASFAFTYGDWLTWSNFTPLFLKPGTTYAYAFHQNPSVWGWAGMSSTPTTTDLYADGQLCLIPPTGGTVTFGSAGTSDAAFCLGLSPIGLTNVTPYANAIAFSPGAVEVAGAQITLTEAAAGLAPLHYQWRTDGGSGGVLTNIPASDATNLTLNTTGRTPGAYRYDVIVTNVYGASTSVVAVLTLTYPDSGATLVDIGTTDPLPVGDNDPAQLTFGGGAPDGLNYWFDNDIPPGQTFVTGGNSAGYQLTSLAIRTGSGSFGYLPAAGQMYVLRLYAVSGTSAFLLKTYSSQTNFTYVPQSWLRWSGLDLPLAPNTTYAYSFGRVSTGSGWQNMSSAGGNLFAGGELVLIPKSGGAMTAGSSHDYDGTFIIGLAVEGCPNVSPAVISPTNTVYAGSPVTASAGVIGAGPFSCQWQTDGGVTGTLTNIPGATNTTLAVDTTGFDGLPVAFRLVASNVSGSTTGEVAVVNVSAGSLPFVIPGFDTTPASASRFVGGAVAFTAAFDGTQPITYQWQVDKGTGYTNLIGRTNSALILSNLAASDAGTYSLLASNSLGTANSAGAVLKVYSTPSGPVSVNFQWHSTEGGDAGSYAGAGIPGFGVGTYWNQITGPSSWSPGTYTSSSGLADDGTTDIGITCSLTTGGSWSQTADSTVPILDSYAMAYTGTPRPVTFDLPNGLYHVALYSCNGSEVSAGNAGTAFTLNGITKTAIPTQHGVFVEGNTYVVFSNVVVTSMSMSATWGGITGHSFGCFNGAQLRYVGPVGTTPGDITALVSGSQLELSWPADNAGWTLQVQTNALSVGLGTNWVDVAGSSEATHISLPISPDNSAVFYRLVLKQ